MIGSIIPFVNLIRRLICAGGMRSCCLRPLGRPLHEGIVIVLIFKSSSVTRTFIVYNSYSKEPLRFKSLK